MLGLRPRPFLRPRPSLLDLIQHKDIEPRSSFPFRPQPLELENPEATPLSEEQEQEQEQAIEAVKVVLPESPEFRKTSVAIGNSVESGTGSRQEQENPSSRTNIANMGSKGQESKEEPLGKGVVFSISGPVIVAEHMIGCAMYELCKVGHDQLVGEVSPPWVEYRSQHAEGRRNACNSLRCWRFTPIVLTGDVYRVAYTFLFRSSESMPTRPQSKSTKRPLV